MPTQSVSQQPAPCRTRPPASCGTLAVTALATACAMLAACAMPTHPESAAPPSDPFNIAATQLLDDTAWTLAVWQTSDGRSHAIAGADDSRGAEAGAPPTLVFSTATGQRRASGFAGCNRFAGPYSLKDGQLSFGPFVTTRIACSGARGELERDYLDALAHIAKTGVQLRAPQELLIVTVSGATLRFTANHNH
jgi:heat shock protein HslJ